jgi:RNA polymerase sigma-70 factor (ECF subfamily)
MVGNAEDARDLAQNVFFKAWARLETFDRNHRFFSWIYRIALNEALNHRRGRRPAEDLNENLRSGLPGPAEGYEAKDEAGRVGLAMARLQNKDRELIVRRHFIRLSHQEMGDVLHVPEKTVKSRLHTARGRLEAELRRQGFGES